MTFKFTPNLESLEKAAAVLYQIAGIEICFPWQGDLDDLEQSRFEGFKAAFIAYLEAEHAAGRAKEAVSCIGTSKLTKERRDEFHINHPVLILHLPKTQKPAD